MRQWETADPDVVRVLQDSPNQPQKLVVDSRYLWPTVLFEKVCQCNGHFGGVDCSECAYGWNGADCETRKDPPVMRKSFSRLSPKEKEDFVDATLELKKETGYWSVVVEEPSNYSGFVTLQNVSTYNFFTYMHSYAARSDAGVCLQADDNITIDFAHAGPVFPVWHRHYLLIVESQFQRIMGNSSFGLPYWQWEKMTRLCLRTSIMAHPPTHHLVLQSTSLGVNSTQIPGTHYVTLNIGKNLVIARCIGKHATQLKT